MDREGPLRFPLRFALRGPLRMTCPASEQGSQHRDPIVNGLHARQIVAKMAWEAGGVSWAGVQPAGTRLGDPDLPLLESQASPLPSLLPSLVV